MKTVNIGYDGGLTPGIWRPNVLKTTSTARFQCVKCAHRWEGRPGPSLPNGGSNPDTICPKCGSLYMVWLNYGKD